MLPPRLAARYYRRRLRRARRQLTELDVAFTAARDQINADARMIERLHEEAATRQAYIADLEACLQFEHRKAAFWKQRVRDLEGGAVAWQAATLAEVKGLNEKAAIVDGLRAAMGGER